MREKCAGLEKYPCVASMHCVSRSQAEAVIGAYRFQARRSRAPEQSKHHHHEHSRYGFDSPTCAGSRPCRHVTRAMKLARHMPNNSRRNAPAGSPVLGSPIQRPASRCMQWHQRGCVSTLEMCERFRRELNKSDTRNRLRPMSRAHYRKELY